jgi:hypothetical protein
VERNKECKETKDGGRKGEVGLWSGEDSGWQEAHDINEWRARAAHW